MSSLANALLFFPIGSMAGYIVWKSLPGFEDPLCAYVYASIAATLFYVLLLGRRGFDRHSLTALTVYIASLGFYLQALGHLHDTEEGLQKCMNGCATQFAMLICVCFFSVQCWWQGGGPAPLEKKVDQYAEVWRKAGGNNQGEK
jgi:hypothetical protein